ncbi:MAG: S46 family peptidase [Bacteroidales bacterium]
MRVKKLILPLFAAAFLSEAKADEGMWLLPLLNQQNAGMMKERGLEMDVTDIYNPDSISLKDAVVQFGRGCTGEVISPEGLVLTNHHCGYGYIQNHSSLEHDYLENGFWAANRQEELPNDGLTVTFIDAIDDVTAYVQDALANDKNKGELDFLSPAYLNKLAVEKKTRRFLDENPGIEVEIKPFYGGNKYYMFTKKVYSDIRLVGTPPSAVGKFGADTDNWMWPRHTGDFSIFRIYADKEGKPAPYSKENEPLKVKKYFNISLKGIQADDFAMVMGFPGRTNHFYTPAEVVERRDLENDVRVKVRDIRQNIMLDAMLKNPATKIRYASKYASSTNSYKSSKGMNRMIGMQDLVGLKEQEQAALLSYARTNNKPEYISAVDSIQKIVAERANLKFRRMMLQETFFTGIEFTSVPTNTASLELALEKKDKAAIIQESEKLQNSFNNWADKNYEAELDQKIAIALIKYYQEQVPAQERPAIFTVIDKSYKGDAAAFITDAFSTSIYGSAANFERFKAKPTLKKLTGDPLILFAKSIREERAQLDKALKTMDENFAIAHKSYVKGLMEINGDNPMYPDANLTLRLTYGNVKSLNAADAVTYDYYTSMDGIMEKEDASNWEFVVPEKLKTLYHAKDFGDYAMNNGKMPVCFVANTHTTGGNSGSPVINASGELIGTGFDRNWEGISGDIQYQPRFQRTLCVDIRYTLFIIEKYAGAKHLIEEMTIIR